MRKFTLLLAVLAGLAISALSPVDAEAGCYRWGWTGYHWYRFCFGPGFLYPHHKICRHGHCWYQ